MKKSVTVILSAALLATTSAWADVAELSLSASGNDIVVSAPAGALAGAADLCLVWDAADHGDNLAAWPTANCLTYGGALSATAASYTFTCAKPGIPSGYVYRAIATTGMRLIDGFVKTTGSQAIDTGIDVSTLNGIDFRFRHTGRTGNAYSQLTGGVQDTFGIGLYNSSGNQFYMRHKSVGYNDAFKGMGNGEWATPHRFAVLNNDVYLDENLLGFKVNGSCLTPVSTNLLLGSCWNKSGGTVNANHVHAEWHYVYLYAQDGSLAAHFVPALDANGNSGLYEAVSGRFCGKLGSAASGEVEYDTAAAATNAFPVAASALALNDIGRRAVWQGTGESPDVSNPANWSCTEDGNPIVDGLPDDNTVVLVTNVLNFNVTSGDNLSYHQLTFSDCTLSQDCDLSGLSVEEYPVLELDSILAPKDSYIDTGFKPNQDTRVTMEVTVNGNSEYWFGAWNSGYKSGAFAVCNDGGNVYLGYGNSATTVSPALTNGCGRTTIDYNKGSLSIEDGNGGTWSYDFAASTFQVNYNLYLFAQNRTGSPFCMGNIRFHSCKIYDDGTLVRDYVPAKRGSVYGLWDKVNKTFVEKSGKGNAFTGGSETGVTLKDRHYVSFDVDLAGHNLSIPTAFVAMEGTITDSAGGGELRVSVPSGATAENSTLALAGKMKLVKSGEGTLVAAKAGQTYTGGTVVSNGLAKSGIADAPWGNAKSLVTVADGAAFDWAGVQSTTSTPYSFAIAGDGPDGAGALINSIDVVTGNWWQYNIIADLELLGDATIGGYPAFGFSLADDAYGRYSHVLTMNGHNLDIQMKAKAGDDRQIFAFRCVQATGGGSITFDKNGSGAHFPFPSFYTGTSDLSGVTFTLGANAGINIDSASVAPKIGTFIDYRSAYNFEASAKKGNAVIVLDAFKPMSTNLVRTIQFGDETHLSPALDLAGIDGPLVVPASGSSLTAASGARVGVKIGDRKIAKDEPIVRWTTAPSGVTFVRGDADRQYSLKVCEDGLYCTSSGFVIIVL